MPSSKFRGCLLGGAIGDALGYPVEFIDRDRILHDYGPQGIRDLVCDRSSGKALITDDTQMTLFTAEGLLWAYKRGQMRGVASYQSCVFYSYQRWLYTQTRRFASDDYNWLLDSRNMEFESPLLEVDELNNERAPGTTCLTSLRGASHQNYGTIERHINNSKGCGGVMRVAPVGLFLHAQPERAFHTAAECAAITHGHPSGYLSAGALAYIIAAVINGSDIRQAALDSLNVLKKYDGHEECLIILQKAIQLADQECDPVEAIDNLGEGWVGEEALAIALYCALKHPDDFKEALCLSVNHDGDSDSTGAICGNILGAYLGIEGIPTDWAGKVELSRLILDMADLLWDDGKIH